MENLENLREKYKDLDRGLLPDDVPVRVHVRFRRDQVTPVVDIKCADAIEDGDMFTTANVNDLWAYMHYMAQNNHDHEGNKKVAEVSYSMPKKPQDGTPVPTLMVGYCHQGKHPLDNIYIFFGVPKGKTTKKGLTLSKDDTKSFEDFKKTFNASK